MLEFFFTPNEFFENTSLKVYFEMLTENDVDKIKGSEIKWKEGKDLTKKTITKKQKNKKTGKTRSITKTVDADSFFHFFDTIDPKKEGGDKKKGDDEEDDEDDATLEKLDIHFDIARTFLDEILEFHLEYYLGVRDEDADDDEFGGDDDGDDDDDNSDDSENEKPKGKKKWECWKIGFFEIHISLLLLFGNVY